MADKPEDLTGKQLDEYSITKTTIHFPGLAQLPPDDDGECIFARVHRPYEQVVVLFEIKSRGGPPVVPSPIDPKSPFGYTENLILLDFQISTPVVMPVGAGNQGHIWIVAGKIVWGKVKAEGPVCDYRIGKMPWEQTSPASYENYLPKENFRTDIIDPTSSVSLDVPLPPGP